MTFMLAGINIWKTRLLLFIFNFLFFLNANNYPKLKNPLEKVFPTDFYYF